MLISMRQKYTVIIRDTSECVDAVCPVLQTSVGKEHLGKIYFTSSEMDETDAHRYNWCRVNVKGGRKLWQGFDRPLMPSVRNRLILYPQSPSGGTAGTAICVTNRIGVFRS
jgi:hypothetical protein